MQRIYAALMYLTFCDQIHDELATQVIFSQHFSSLTFLVLHIITTDTAPCAHIYHVGTIVLLEYSKGTINLPHVLHNPQYPVLGALP